MTGKIIARDLMQTTFLRLGAGHTLREATGILLDPLARQEDPRVLVVLNPDGSLAGLLTTRLLLRALVDAGPGEGAEAADETNCERLLLGAVQQRLDLRVADILSADFPVAAPHDRLPRLIELIQNRRFDSIPVVEEGRVVGIVFLTSVFNAAAALALAAQADEEEARA